MNIRLTMISSFILSPSPVQNLCQEVVVTKARILLHFDVNEVLRMRKREREREASHTHKIKDVKTLFWRKRKKWKKKSIDLGVKHFFHYFYEFKRMQLGGMLKTIFFLWWVDENFFIALLMRPLFPMGEQLQRDIFTKCYLKRIKNILRFFLRNF